MGQEIQLISDGDGLAVIGDPAVVDAFLASEGLESKELSLQRLGPAFSAGSGITKAGAEIAANSGRWVKLTEESARAADKFGLMANSKTGLSMGVVTRQNGQIHSIVQFTRGSILTNPAVLAGAAGIMAQLAMQQTMDEITDYLATIDAKVDQVLRAQKDAVVSDMIGVDLVIEEAMTIRNQVGRVSETTWSKVQATSMTVARTQAYALRQLDALAENLERTTKVGDLAKASHDAEKTTQEWLAVLARCFQLQDAIAVLELDRVFDESPEELDQHRLALRVARKNRLELISRTTERLLGRMQAAAGVANAKVLLHPTASGAVVQSSNDVTVAVIDFHGRLGIESGRQVLEARRWFDAATEVRDKMLVTGSDGVDTVKRFGGDAIERTAAVTNRISGGLADRTLRRRSNEERRAEED